MEELDIPVYTNDDEVSYRDSKMSLYICSYIFFNVLNAGLQNGLGLSGQLLTIEKTFIQIILIGLLLRVVHKMPLAQFEAFIVAEALSIFFLFFSLVLGSSIASLKSTGITITSVCVPCALCAYWITDKNVFYNYMLRFSWLIFGADILSLLGNTSTSYDMHFSYAMLFVLLIHLNEWFESGKNSYLLFSLLEITLILIFGSRGALVCFMVFVAFRICFSSMFASRKLMLIICIFIIICVLVIFSDSIITFLYDNLASKGYYVRTLRLLKEGQFVSHDSGRNELWDTTIALIKKHPFTGWGINGAVDYLLGQPYPHQLFLDLMLTFGIPFGSVVSIIIVWACLGWFNVQPEIDKKLDMMFVSMGFVSLMFTGTVFTNYYASIMFGLLFSKYKRKSIQEF